MPARRLSKALFARLLLCLAAGVLGMFAFTLSPQNYVGISDPPLAAGSPTWLLYALLLGGLFFIASDRRGLRVSPGMATLGLLFGVVNYFATTLFAYDTWSFLNSPAAWIGAILHILGQSAVMAAVIALVCARLEGVRRAHSAENTLRARGGRLLARVNTRFPRFTAWRRRHPMAAVMLLLLACWSPYLLVFYPGTVIWDMGEMLGGLYGLRTLSTWHPMFTTWLFGGCVWLGRLFGSDNLGTFLFTLLQTLLLAYALADALRLMRRLKLSRVWRFATLMLFGLTPIFGSFAQAVGKDTLYAAALLLFAVRTAEILRFGVPNRKGLWQYAAFAVLACLLRNNGLYVVLPTALLTVLFGARGRGRAVLASVATAAFALVFAFSSLLVPALGIADETASGLYSVCFQQTARTLRDHADTVTPEEYAAIDKVLDAASLATLYEANISDPVKFTFRQYGQGAAVERAALADYRKTWLSMFAKYPLTYLEAFVAGSSGYYAFTPKIDAAQTYHDQGGIRFVFETYDLGADSRYLHTTQIAAFSKARELLAAYSRGWRRVPLLELALYCPTYVWLLAAAALSLLWRRRYRLLIAYLPALLSLGVCMLSPVNDYFRYFLPIVAMLFPLLGLAREPVSQTAPAASASVSMQAAA